MSKKRDAAKQVRLERNTHSELVKIQKNCDWPVSLTTLAAHALKNGLDQTRAAFNVKGK
jgi:hypothetical protein